MEIGRNNGNNNTIYVDIDNNDNNYKSDDSSCDTTIKDIRRFSSSHLWSSIVLLYMMVFGYLPFCEEDKNENIDNNIKGNYEILIGERLKFAYFFYF